MNCLYCSCNNNKVVIQVSNCMLYGVYCRGNAQVHSRAVEHKPGALVYKSSIGCVQELRQVRRRHPQPEVSTTAQRHCIGDCTESVWCASHIRTWLPSSVPSRHAPLIHVPLYTCTIITTDHHHYHIYIVYLSVSLSLCLSACLCF